MIIGFIVSGLGIRGETLTDIITTHIIRAWNYKPFFVSVIHALFKPKMIRVFIADTIPFQASSICRVSIGYRKKPKCDYLQSKNSFIHQSGSMTA